MRINLKDGNVLEQIIPSDAWFYHPEAALGGNDVALIPYLIASDEDIKSLPLFGDNGFEATSEVMTRANIGVGDELFVIGLFKSHYGKERNIPLVRIGNLASMRDETSVDTSLRVYGSLPNRSSFRWRPEWIACVCTSIPKSISKLPKP